MCLVEGLPARPAVEKLEKSRLKFILVEVKMSPIPAFDGRGFLPPYLGSDGTTDLRSPYDASMSDLLAALGASPYRQNLLLGLIQYREMLTSFGYIDGLQFIDGSFVENVEVREGRDPNDIDVFSYLMLPADYLADPQKWVSVGFPQWTGEVANRNKNKTRFGLDTYAIAVNTIKPLGLIDQTIYWYSLFSHKRTTQDWKGFVRIPLNPADDAIAKTAIISGA